jgi:hypothetical protein
MIISLSGKKQSGKDLIADIIKSLIYCKIDGTELTEENFESIRHCRIYNYKVKKFAGKLKEVAAIMLGCNASDFESEEFKNSTLGEEWWYYKTTYKERSGNLQSEIIAPYLEEYRTETQNTLFSLSKNYVLARMTPRIFLQKFATDAVRSNLHPCSWINSTLADYNSKEFWVITDTRFENEVNAIRYKEPNFLNIRVDRWQTFEQWCKQYEGFVTFIKNPEGWLPNNKISSNDFLIQFLLSNSFKDCLEINRETIDILIDNLYHESETQLDNYGNFSYFIRNEGSIGELIIKVREIMFEKKLL